MVRNTSFAPQVTNADSGRRITIPQQHCEKIPWVTGGKPLHGWLLMLGPGRFRLLSDLEIEQEPKLREARLMIISGPVEVGVSPTDFEDNERAVLIGRLVPTTLSPHLSSWRLVIPEQIVPDIKARPTFVLLFSMGYLEIWFRDIYEVALTPSLNLVI